jgi:peptide/nickel transport system substrate-binding protein
MVPLMLRPTLALVALAAIASCKSDTQSKGGSPKPADGSGSTSMQKGGMVHIPSNEPKYLNPVLEPRFVPANDLIFEGLVGLDGKGNPVPRLAQSWDVANDGKTITFKLREGVKWHDGEKFTSADVAFTLDAIRGTSAATVWKAYLATVTQLTTPDDRTVVVTYSEPYAAALVTWTVGILPKHRFEGTDLTNAPANTEPVGTGPFKYTRWELGKALYLEANKDWWQKQPHLDGIEFVFGVADADMLESLRRGQLDWVKVGDVDKWLSVAQTGEFHEEFETSEVVEARIRLIAWNTQRTQLADKRVRQALTYALDRPRVITDVMYGQAQALAAPLFPTMFGHDPSVAPLPFDLAQAKTLLDAAAPAKAGKRFALEVIAVESLRGPSTDSMVSIFKHDLATLGIDFKLTVLASKDYYERIARRDYDGVYFGWLPDIPDPDPAALLHSQQAQSGANFAAYSNADVDKLINDAERTMDRDARRKMYEQLEHVLVDEMPYTPLFAPYGHYAWSRRLHGVTTKDVAPTPPLPGVAGWWLSKK